MKRTKTNKLEYIEERDREMDRKSQKQKIKKIKKYPNVEKRKKRRRKILTDYHRTKKKLGEGSKDRNKR